MIFALLVWASLVGLAVMAMRRPTKRKSQDELEAVLSALKHRIIDLEDQLEHHVKREAVRIGRDKRESAQGALPLSGGLDTDRPARLAALRSEHAKRLLSGAV
jgi:hypothetical protein